MISAYIPLQACSIFKYTEETSFEVQGKLLVGREGGESFLNMCVIQLWNSSLQDSIKTKNVMRRREVEKLTDE